MQRNQKDLARYSGRIGVRVIALRTKAALSQRKLAHLAGVSWDTVSRIEKGQALGVSLEKMLRIQAVLGLLSIEDLMEDPAPTSSAALGTALLSEFPGPKSARPPTHRERAARGR